MRMGIMKVEADAALAQKSAAQAARAARRRKEEVRKEFRVAMTPNGLEVGSCLCLTLTALSRLSVLQNSICIPHAPWAATSFQKVLTYRTAFVPCFLPYTWQDPFAESDHVPLQA